MKTIFIPAFYNKKIDKKLLDAINAATREYRKIGIFSTVQFMKNTNEVKAALEKKGKSVGIAKKEVIGCDLADAKALEKKAECFVFLGSGKFHPYALETEKEIFIANPLTNEVSKVDRIEVERFIKRKEQMRALTINANVLGILVSTKPGQQRLKDAIALKKRLEKKGKHVYIFTFDTLVPEELANFPQIQAWINSACPRIVDDWHRFDKPIVNIDELS